MYRGSSTAGSACYVWEQDRTPRVYRGSSTAGSAAYTLEYYNSLLRIYRGSSTAGSPLAVIENWDELPKPMLMFILVLLGE